MSDNDTSLIKKKHHPGQKGTDSMNTLTKDEQKELRRDIIETCRTMIGRGYTYNMKVDALCKHYEVSIRQAKKYLSYTKADIQKRKQENYQAEYDEVLIRLDTMYTDLYKAGNIPEALKVLNQLIKLRGYEAPKQLMIKQEVDVRNDLSHLSAEQLLLLQNLLNPSNYNEGES
jgi:hypothetical protein